MPSPTLRLFVALYPPPEVVRSLLDELKTLDLPAYRPSPPEQVHLTLQFIGAVPVRELDEVAESVDRAIAGVDGLVGGVELEVTGRCALPKRGPARLIAATLAAPPPLLELQRRLALRLARSPRAMAGDRFLPHMTLCRFRAPHSLRERARRARSHRFRAEAIRLMRSVLRPDGAEHREVRAYPFSPAA